MDDLWLTNAQSSKQVSDAGQVSTPSDVLLLNKGGSFGKLSGSVAVHASKGFASECGSSILGCWLYLAQASDACEVGYVCLAQGPLPVIHGYNYSPAPPNTTPRLKFH